MAIPTYLDTAFRYFERIGVTDVQQIIDDVEDEVLASAGLGSQEWSPWTNPSANLYRSPVDAWNRHMDVLLTRISQQKMELRLRDQSLDTIMTRRINLSPTLSWTVRIYSGPYHLHIDVFQGGILSEGFNCNIIDLSPDMQDCHPIYVCGNGTRDTSDVNNNSSYPDQLYMKNGTDAASMVARVANYQSQTNGSSIGYRTLSGARVFRTREVWTQQVGASGMFGYWHHAGICYQQLLCPPQMCREQSRQYVPIDTGIMGVFRVVGGAARWTSSGFGALCVRMA